jgi:hypothetical protein
LRRRIILAVILLAAFIVLLRVAVLAGEFDTVITAATFDAARENRTVLRAFLHRMPKGGDLHTHLAGAVYAERFIAWAAQQELCVDPQKVVVAKPQCDRAGALPVSDAMRDQKLYKLKVANSNPVDIANSLNDLGISNRQQIALQTEYTPGCTKACRARTNAWEGVGSRLRGCGPRAISNRVASGGCPNLNFQRAFCSATIAALTAAASQLSWSSHVVVPLLRPCWRLRHGRAA